MRVKELIARLLEENMNAEVYVATTDESRKTETSTEKNNVAFAIKEVEHWNYSVYIGFTDWRNKEEKKTMKVVLDNGAYEPVRAHDTDAGLDLRTPIEFTIRPHDSCVIDTGVHIELPRGTFGQLFSKSGLNVKRSIVSLGGTIDEGYTGSITVKLYNEGDEEYHFRPGDKIVQLVIMPYLAPEIEYVNELGNTDRGDNGFGSTGK